MPPWLARSDVGESCQCITNARMDLCSLRRNAQRRLLFAQPFHGLVVEKNRHSLLGNPPGPAGKIPSWIKHLNSEAHASCRNREGELGEIRTLAPIWHLRITIDLHCRINPTRSERFSDESGHDYYARVKIRRRPVPRYESWR